jgi:hypothetical protein
MNALSTRDSYRSIRRAVKDWEHKLVLLSRWYGMGTVFRVNDIECS